MYEVLEEGDIVKLLVEDKETAYFFIKKIEFDKDDECGLWWQITFEAVNNSNVIFKLLLDDNHIRQEVFFLKGVKHQVVLYARPVLFVEDKETKQTINKQDNISLF